MRIATVESNDRPAEESPDYVRLSLAAAMTLGFVKGWFYRNARLGCINLLLTYAGGCKANCAFCGLAGEKNRLPADRRFIRVPWKTFAADRVIAFHDRATGETIQQNAYDSRFRRTKRVEHLDSDGDTVRVVAESSAAAATPAKP